MTWLDSLRQLQWQYRAAIALASGAIAYWLLQVVLRKDPNKQRLEASVVGGIAVAILVWLLLEPQVSAGEQPAGSTTSPQDLYYNIYAPNLAPGGSVSPINIPGLAPVTINVPPLDFGYIAPSYQVVSPCGCDSRNSMATQLLDTLWEALHTAGLA